MISKTKNHCVTSKERPAKVNMYEEKGSNATRIKTISFENNLYCRGIHLHLKLQKFQ